LALETEGLKVVGAADVSPDKAGKDLGVVLGLPKKLRLKVVADSVKLLRKTKADIAVLSTTSAVRDVKAQIAALVHKGLHVVTTCEELAYPTPSRAAAFREIDQMARKKKVSVLGTGINPGYVMDALALFLTAPCAQVSRVSVTRVVDAATRRLPLQRKVGAGLTIAQFNRAKTEGSVRHVGLPESVHMIAASLGWKLDRVDETLEPAIAPRDLDTQELRIPAGAATGIRQSVRAYRSGELAISLDLQVYVGAESPRDHILIDGDPSLDATLAGGINGETATAAVLLNSLPRLLAAPAGLLTVRDLPLVHALNPQDLAVPVPRKR
jgi:4-hydroxy-tetrahydrodipicolinate reductase